MKRIPQKLYVVFVKVPMSLGWTPIAYTHTWAAAQREAAMEYGKIRIAVYKRTGFEMLLT